MPCTPPYTKKDSPYSLKDTPFSNKENPYSLKDNPFSNTEKPYIKTDNPYIKISNPYEVKSNPYSATQNPYEIKSVTTTKQSPYTKLCIEGELEPTLHEIDLTKPYFIRVDNYYWYKTSLGIPPIQAGDVFAVVLSDTQRTGFTEVTLGNNIGELIEVNILSVTNPTNIGQAIGLDGYNQYLQLIDFVEDFTAQEGMYLQKLEI